MRSARSTSIMRVLIWKEVRQQALITACLSLLPVVVCVGASQQSGADVGIVAALILYCVLPLVLGTNAFAGEQESGTARFLSALPVRSRKLFLSKYLTTVGLSVIGFLPVGCVLVWALVWGGFELPMHPMERVLALLGGVGGLLGVCALPALSAMVGGGVILGLCIYPAIAGVVVGWGIVCFDVLHGRFGLSELAAGTVSGTAAGVWLGGVVWCWCKCRMMRVRRRFALLWTGGMFLIPVGVGIGLYVAGVMAAPGGVFPLRYSVSTRQFYLAPSPDGRALLTQETFRRWCDGTRTALWLSSDAGPHWLSRFRVSSIRGKEEFVPSDFRVISIRGKKRRVPTENNASWIPETPWSPDGSQCIIDAPGRPLDPLGLWLMKLGLTGHWPPYFHGPTVLDVGTGHGQRLPPGCPWRWLDERRVWAPAPDGNIRFLELDTGREVVAAKPEGVVGTTDSRPPGLPLETSLVRGGRVFSYRFARSEKETTNRASIVAYTPEGSATARNFEYDWGDAWPRVEDMNSVGETVVLVDVWRELMPEKFTPAGWRVYILSFAEGTVREVAPVESGDEYWAGACRGAWFVRDGTLLLVSASELPGLALVELPDGNARPLLSMEQIEALRLPTLVWRVALSPDRRHALVHLGCAPETCRATPRGVVAVDLESGETTTLWQSPAEAGLAEWWGNDKVLILTRQGLWELGVDGENKRQLLP